MSLVDCPSIFIILSPALIPAFHAGVSSIGAITVNAPSLMPI